MFSWKAAVAAAGAYWVLHNARKKREEARMSDEDLASATTKKSVKVEPVTLETKEILANGHAHNDTGNHDTVKH